MILLRDRPDPLIQHDYGLLDSLSQWMLEHKVLDIDMPKPRGWGKTTMLVNLLNLSDNACLIINPGWNYRDINKVSIKKSEHVFTSNHMANGFSGYDYILFDNVAEELTGSILACVRPKYGYIRIFTP